ncbi:MAG TPA: phosphotransferase [Alphaproteobacteria bacterium]|nr:phosphotransferase [Alphaproteobacteria bacterium]
MTAVEDRILHLPCWSGTVETEPLQGGITNRNFLVRDRVGQFVVRVGGDIPIHGVMRFNELAASRAAHAADLSPEVVYAEPGVMVLRFIEGRTLTPEDVRERSMLSRILPLLKRCHHDVAKHLRGPVLAFSPFHVIRDYGATLGAAMGRRSNELSRLTEVAARLEREVGPFRPVFAHNDMLAANFLDDGDRLWLIDWEYGGFGSELFDLGGVAANNRLRSEDETWLLEGYFARRVDDELRRRYTAMKCAAALREALWGLVSEIHSAVDYDFVGYSDACFETFEDALAKFQRDWNSQ